MCNHKICEKIKKINKNVNAAGCLLFKNINNINILFLGLETKGPRINHYNICVGHMDYADNGCCLSNLSRELLEEFGVHTSFEYPNTFDMIFKLPFGKFIYTIIGNVVVFLGVLPKETSRTLFNKSIINNRYLGPTYNEMKYINSFYTSLLPIDNKYPNFPITDITKIALNYFKGNGFL